MEDVDFGFVFDFGSDEEFVARRGQGACLDGSRLESTPVDRSMLEVVGIESADPELVAASVSALAGRAHRLRVVGSIAITACQVAAGRFDGMFSLRPCRSVDAAAAQLIVREAGGRIELGPGGLAEVGFGLDVRFPIRAATTVAGLDVLREAQELSPGFS
jgi:myo-inositol-1(or 4)-monophosphatase